ncbi:MAG: hypothetical protein ACI8WB_004481 [Phenylobacterium sp.]|jgi:hypothetical protein
MTLNDLTVNFTHLNRAYLLSEWHWLIGVEKMPILLSASGDAFLQDSNDGSIMVLDTCNGKLTEIAGSFDQFSSLLTNKDFLMEYLAVQLVEDLMKAGTKLSEGKIYSFKKLPVLGGELSPENIDTVDIEVHFSMTGQIHQQVQNLPDGTPTDNIVLN